MIGAAHDMRRTWLRLGAVALAFALLALLVRNSYHQLILTQVAIWAGVGLAWNLFSGYSGLISFGHAAFFGLGAYTVGLGLALLGISPLLTIPIAASIGALAGALIGLPTFRLRGHYFALAMLACPLALLYVFEWLGYQELALPMQRAAPGWYLQFRDPRIHTWLALLLMLIAAAITLRVEQSRLGWSLRAIRQDELAAETAGIDTRRCKLIAFVLSAALSAGIGGYYAVVLLVVTPGAVFGMLVSAQALTVAMFGGAGTLWGPMLGAAILVPLGELLHAELGSVLPGIQGVVYGVAIVLVILLAPEGIYWQLRRRAAPLPIGLAARPDGAPPMDVPAAPRPAAGTVLLQARGLCKAYGGLRAVQDVSFEVRAGEILGIIGPNGAGKTSLFNLLNGIERPDAGEVRFLDRPLTGMPPHRICRLGIGRTFQVAKPFARLSLAANVLIGALAAGAALDVAWLRALAALARVGLARERAAAPAAQASNLELRLMELARALAGAPQLLLLDEILAGLAPEEIEALLPVLKRLAGEGIAIVIIEHTMQAMVRLADRFLVLDQGAVLAEGEPAAVVADPRVINAYLGRHWHAAAH